MPLNPLSPFDQFCCGRWRSLLDLVQRMGSSKCVAILQKQLAHNRCDDGMVWSQVGALWTRPDPTLSESELKEIGTFLVTIALLHVDDPNGRGIRVPSSYQTMLLKILEVYVDVSLLGLDKIKPATLPPALLEIIEDWIANGARPFYVKWILDDIMHGGGTLQTRFASKLSAKERQKLAKAIARITASSPTTSLGSASTDYQPVDCSELDLI